MKKNNTTKDEELDYGSYKINKEISAKIHEQAKRLGYKYILEKLKKYGFSNPEKLAENILKEK